MVPLCSLWISRTGVIWCGGSKGFTLATNKLLAINCAFHCHAVVRSFVLYFSELMVEIISVTNGNVTYKVSLDGRSNRMLSVL